MSSTSPEYQSAPVDARPITPKARRRSWGEPAVSTWWLLALALLFVAGWILVEQFMTIRSGQWKIDHWQRIPEAHIDRIDLSSRETYRPPLEQLAIMESTLSYVSPDGSKHELKGKLKAQRRPVHPGAVIPILINPEKPDEWTDRVVADPALEQLLVPLLLLPFPVIFLLVAIWQRQRVLKLWRTGARRQASVLDTRQSAASPRSAMVRCTLVDSRDKRIINVVIPRSAARLKRGDTFTIVTPTAEPTRAIAAMLYE